jgi:hypothetical protein
MMALYRHAPIVSDDIYPILLNLPWWEIPVTGIPHIGLINLPFVNKKPPVLKLNTFAPHGDHPFQ